MIPATWREPVNAARKHAIRGKTDGGGLCRIRLVRRLLFGKSVGPFFKREPTNGSASGSGADEPSGNAQGTFGRVRRKVGSRALRHTSSRRALPFRFQEFTI